MQVRAVFLGWVVFIVIAGFPILYFLYTQGAENYAYAVKGNDSSGNTAGSMQTGPVPGRYISISGIVHPDFEYDSKHASFVKSGFKIEILGMDTCTYTDHQGYFTLRGVPSNGKEFSIRISKKNFLSRTVSGIQGTKNIMVGTPQKPIKMWAGDAEVSGVQDGAINMLDLKEIIMYYQSINGDGRYFRDYDFNGNNRINMGDILICLHHYNKSSSDYRDDFEVTSADPQREYNVVAYLSDYNSWETVNVRNVTHLNYAFANCQDSEVRGGNAFSLSKLKDLKKVNPHLKILLSVGGWHMSKGFHEAAMTEKSRNKFADSAIKYLTEFQLDGIDIDWEYPGQPGDGNPFGAEDKHNFTLLLQNLRKKLDQQGEKDKQKYLLTIVTGANTPYMENVEMNLIHPLVDYLNVMTFDFCGLWSRKTAHHSNLFSSKMSPNQGLSGDLAIGFHKTAGVPPYKLNVGVPFYGIGFYGVKSEENQGLGQEFEGGVFDVAFSRLRTDYINKNGYQYHWDPYAKTPYLWNKKSKIFITFENKDSLKAKSEYIKTQGLGGFFIWEYTRDASGELIAGMTECLK